MRWDEIAPNLEATVLKLVHRASARGCRVIRNSAQAIASGTATALEWNTVVFDTDGCWSAGDPTRLTARRDGCYLAGGGFLLNGPEITADNRLSIWVRANETQTLARHDTYARSGIAYHLSITTGMIWLATGEYVEIRMSHEIGATKNIGAASLSSQQINYGWLMRVS